MKRGRKKRSQEEKRAHARFRSVVLNSGPCLFSETRAGHQCSGHMDPHHAVPKQYLKAHFSTMPNKWELVYAPEIGVPLCSDAHSLVTTNALYIFMDELPASVVDWCKDWGIFHRLERECPPLGDRQAAG